MVKAVVLAAGYGTRLERDILKDPSGKYKHLVGLPKPLVPVDGRPLINHWLELLLAANLSVDDIFVVTNAHFYDKFAAWAKDNNVPVENIVNDGTTNNDNRLGACRDIKFIIEQKKIDDDLMVIGGDTLFFEDFKLTDVRKAFDEKKTNVILWYPIEKDIDTLKTGVLELSDEGIVTAFLEKPDPSATKSRSGCPCFYMYRRETLALFDTFISQAKSLSEADAPGHFCAWVWNKSPCYAHYVSGRFDIGGLDSYIECEEIVQKKKAAAAAAAAAAL